jgi:hypothetical protein
MATANPEKGEFGIVIGDKPYVLCMTFNGLIDLQNLFAKDGAMPSIESILLRAQRGELVAVRGVFWATLRRHHPELTVEQAGELIHEAGGAGAVDALLQNAGATSAPDPRDLAAVGGAAARPPKGRRARGTGARLN